MLAGKKRSRKSADGDSSAKATTKKTKHGKQGAAAPKHGGGAYPNPASLLDRESIDCLASPCGRTSQPIRTPVLSADDKDILIDRLTKEVVDKFDFTLSRKVERTRSADGSTGAVTFTMGSGGIKMIGMDGGDDNNSSKEDKDNKGKNKKKRRDQSFCQLSENQHCRILWSRSDSLSASINAPVRWRRPPTGRPASPPSYCCRATSVLRRY